MDYMHRGAINYLRYKVELDGKFLKWDDVWAASEKDGYIFKIVHQPEFDHFGNITRQPITTKVYGRVFIVRFETEAE